MHTSQYLDVFITPSVRAIALAACSYASLMAFVLMAPITLWAKALLVITLNMMAMWEGWRNVLLMHASSVVRLGHDHSGWWVQQRNGRKYSVCLSTSVRWSWLVSLSFSSVEDGWRAMMPGIGGNRGVLLFRDHFEHADEFRRLQYVLYTHDQHLQ